MSRQTQDYERVMVSSLCLFFYFNFFIIRTMKQRQAERQMQAERQNIEQDQNKENDTQVSGMLQLRVMCSFCSSNWSISEG